MDLYCIVISAALNPTTPLVTAETFNQEARISIVQPAAPDNLALFVEIVEREIIRPGRMRDTKHYRMTTLPDVAISAWPDRDDPLVTITFLRHGRKFANEYYNPSPNHVRMVIQIILAVAEMAKVTA